MGCTDGLCLGRLEARAFTSSGLNSWADAGSHGNANSRADPHSHAGLDSHAHGSRQPVKRPECMGSLAETTHW